MNAIQIAKRNQIIEFLCRRTDLVPDVVHPYLQRFYPLPTHDQYAQILLADTEFRALQLGTWLGTTDGQIIGQAVEQVIPPFYRPEYDLLVNGLTLAANLQAQEGQQVAGRVALGVIGATLLVGGLALIAQDAA